MILTVFLPATFLEKLKKSLEKFLAPRMFHTQPRVLVLKHWQNLARLAEFPLFLHTSTHRKGHAGTSSLGSFGGLLDSCGTFTIFPVSAAGANIWEVSILALNLSMLASRVSMWKPCSARIGGSLFSSMYGSLEVDEKAEDCVEVEVVELGQLTLSS